MNALTRDDRQALRRADLVVVRVLPTSDGPRGYLELVSEAGPDTPTRDRLFPFHDPDRGLDEDERRRVVPVRAVIGPVGAHQPEQAWVFGHLLRGRHRLAGLARLVDPGEGLAVRVQVDNNTPLVSEAGLVCDTLVVCALGPDGRTRAEIGFDLVRRDDTARAARPVGSAVHGTWHLDVDAFAATLDHAAGEADEIAVSHPAQASTSGPDRS